MGPLVRVDRVTAGLLDSGAGDDFTAAPRARPGGRHRPVGRMGTPADVAEACLYLSSDAASYVAGANLVVHGGGEPPPYPGGRGRTLWRAVHACGGVIGCPFFGFD